MNKKVTELFAKTGDYVKDLNSNISSILKKPKKTVLKKREFDVDTFEKVIDKYHQRRSCRNFFPKEVDFKIVYEIIDASLRVPCAGGIQNIYVIAIEDHHHIHDLARIHGEQGWAGKAPLMLAIVRDNSEFEKMYPHDFENLSLQNSAYVSSSIVNLLALTDLGCCVIRAGDNEKTCKILGVDSSMSVDCLIPIGYSDDLPGIFSRFPTSSRFYFEKFGNGDRGGGGHH
ncbi:MAG: nitroreductase family protein [Nanoarchaeales archaeon]|nr:nitroreductase family protein [Nanoarchaeales archaeon]